MRFDVDTLSVTILGKLLLSDQSLPNSQWTKSNNFIFAALE